MCLQLFAVEGVEVQASACGPACVSVSLELLHHTADHLKQVCISHEL